MEWLRPHSGGLTYCEDGCLGFCLHKSSLAGFVVLILSDHSARGFSAQLLNEEEEGGGG